MQRSGEGGGDGGGTEGPHTAHCHARVLGLQHHACAAGVKSRGQAVGDLLGQPFLGLRPGGEVLDEAGQLGQAEDALARQIADVRDAGEGQQMVFADRPERDGPRQDEFAVARRRWGR